MREFSFDYLKFRLSLVLGDVISSPLTYWLASMNSHIIGLYRMGTLNRLMIVQFSI